MKERSKLKNTLCGVGRWIVYIIAGGSWLNLITYFFATTLFSVQTVRPGFMVGVLVRIGIFSIWSVYLFRSNKKRISDQSMKRQAVPPEPVKDHQA